MASYSKMNLLKSKTILSTAESSYLRNDSYNSTLTNIKNMINNNYRNYKILQKNNNTINNAKSSKMPQAKNSISTYTEKEICMRKGTSIDKDYLNNTNSIVFNTENPVTNSSVKEIKISSIEAKQKPQFISNYMPIKPELYEENSTNNNCNPKGFDTRTIEYPSTFNCNNFSNNTTNKEDYNLKFPKYKYQRCYQSMNTPEEKLNNNHQRGMSGVTSTTGLTENNDKVNNNINKVNSNSICNYNNNNVIQNIKYKNIENFNQKNNVFLRSNSFNDKDMFSYSSYHHRLNYKSNLTAYDFNHRESSYRRDDHITYKNSYFTNRFQNNYLVYPELEPIRIKTQFISQDSKERIFPGTTARQGISKPGLYYSKSINFNNEESTNKQIIHNSLFNNKDKFSGINQKIEPNRIKNDTMNNIFNLKLGSNKIIGYSIVKEPQQVLVKPSIRIDVINLFFYYVIIIIIYFLILA